MKQTTQCIIQAVMMVIFAAVCGWLWSIKGQSVFLYVSGLCTGLAFFWVLGWAIEKRLARERQKVDAQ